VQVLMSYSLLQVLSAMPIDKRKGLSTAVAKPSGATCRECVRDWLAQEVVPQAVTACSGKEVTLVDGRSIVEMISEYRDLDFFVARQVPYWLAGDCSNMSKALPLLSKTRPTRRLLHSKLF
jgi:hypothetical protein